MQGSTKDKVLFILEESRGKSISGAGIAQKLEISRNAVWKAIKLLQAEGHQIDAGTNKGYRLCQDNDILSVSGMLPYLAGLPPPRLYQELESTNIVAKEMSAAGAGHGTCVMAERQTAGRGRQGRSFFSPPGHGIYMSIVLEPKKLGHETPSFITIYTAVAVCEAIEALCPNKYPKIKWVNDLFLEGKKICGISAEADLELNTGAINRVVVGVGINFTLSKDLPKELKPIVGALYNNEKPPINRNQLAAQILKQITNPKPPPQAEIIQNYKQRLFILGQKLQVLSNQPYEATAQDITQEGHLIVQTTTGQKITLSAGEISIKPKD